MRTTPDALMLFAAGFGTRMGALTRDRPKPLVQVAGKALLDHALDLARDAHLSRIVVNTHYFAEQIADHLAGTEVLISEESAQILETGGGLKKALPLLGDGPVITMNTDAIWRGENVITQLQEAWDPARMGALLALVPCANALGHAGAGDFEICPDGRIRRGKGHVYTGAQILNPAGLETIQQQVFSLNLFWDQLLAEGKVFGLVYQGGWCDVGHPESIALAEELLHAGAR